MQKLYYQHNFFENSIKGLIYYLNQLMKPFANTLNNDSFPISVPNTGDEQFLRDMIDDKKIYDYVPRWSINILGINNNENDRTNPNENGTFVAKTVNAAKRSKSTNFSAPLVRRPVVIGLATEVLFSDIFEYFRFVEIYLILSTNPHVYKFEHAGRVHIGTFTFPELSDSDVNFELGMEANKRERKLPINFELTLQFPAYQIYGIPGTSNSGWEDGTGGGTTDLSAGPMLKIIHNLYPKENEQDTSDLVITQIITKPIPDDIEGEIDDSDDK